VPLIDDPTLISPQVLAVVYPAMDGRREVVVKAHMSEVTSRRPAARTTPAGPRKRQGRRACPLGDTLPAHNHPVELAGNRRVRTGAHHDQPVHDGKVHQPHGRQRITVKMSRPTGTVASSRSDSARSREANSPRVSRHPAASRPVRDITLTVGGSAPTQHAIGNWWEPTRNNGQTASLQNSECTGLFGPCISAMTSAYYRTSSPVTALPMIMRWISDVPSKIVKLRE
jgi:hypothetical protein